MRLIPAMLAIWGTVVFGMIALLVYNATCCTCRQRRASAPGDLVETGRRRSILNRARKIHPYIRAFGNLSALLTAGLAGVASWAAIETLIH